MAERLAYLEAVVGADVTGFRRSMREIRNDVGLLSDVTRGISTVARNMTFAVSAPLAAIGSFAVEAASDFDASMRNINAIAGLSEQELSALSDRMIEFGSTTRSGAIESANALYTVFSAGITDADTALATMETSVLTAEAGLASLETTTEAVVATLLSFGYETETVDDRLEQISDSLSHMVNVGVGSMEEFANALANVVPSAAAVNMSIEELYGNMAFLTQRGLSPAKAATSLNAALTALTKPTKAMKAAFAELGVDGMEALIEKTGGVNASMVALMRTTDGTQKELQAMFNNIRGARAINLFNKDIDAWIAAIEEFERSAEGATLRAWEQQMKSVAAQTDLAKSAMQSMAIIIGNELTPYLLPVIGLVTDFGLGIRDIESDTLKAGAAIGILAVAIPPLVWAVTSLVSPLGAFIALLGVLGGYTFENIAGIEGVFTGIADEILGTDAIEEAKDAIVDIVNLLLPDDPLQESVKIGDIVELTLDAGDLANSIKLTNESDKPVRLWDIWIGNEELQAAWENDWLAFVKEVFPSGKTRQIEPGETLIVRFPGIDIEIGEDSDIEQVFDTAIGRFAGYVVRSGNKFEEYWLKEGGTHFRSIGLDEEMWGSGEDMFNVPPTPDMEQVDRSVAILGEALTTMYQNAVMWVADKGLAKIAYAVGFVSTAVVSMLAKGIVSVFSTVLGQADGDVVGFIDNNIIDPFNKGVTDSMDKLGIVDVDNPAETIVTKLAAGLIGLSVGGGLLKGAFTLLIKSAIGAIGFLPFGQTIISGITTAMTTALNAAKAAGAKGLAGLAGKMGFSSGNVMEGAGAGVEVAGEAAGGATDVIGEAIGSVVEVIGEGLGAAISTAGDVFANKVELAAETFGAKIEVASELIGAGVEILSPLVGFFIGEAVGTIGWHIGRGLELIGVREDPASRMKRLYAEGVAKGFDDSKSTITEAIKAGFGTDKDQVYTVNVPMITVTTLTSYVGTSTINATNSILDITSADLSVTVATIEITSGILDLSDIATPMTASELLSEVNIGIISLPTMSAYAGSLTLLTPETNINLTTAYLEISTADINSLSLDMVAIAALTTFAVSSKLTSVSTNITTANAVINIGSTSLDLTAFITPITVSDIVNELSDSTISITTMIGYANSSNIIAASTSIYTISSDISVASASFDLTEFITPITSDDLIANVSSINVDSIILDSMTSFISNSNIISAGLSANVLVGNFSIASAELDLTKFITPITSDDVIGTIDITTLTIGALSALISTMSITTSLSSLFTTNAVVSIATASLDLSEFITPITTEDLINNISTLTIANLSIASMNSLVNNSRIITSSSDIISGLATITITSASIDLSQFITPITSEDIIGSLESLNIGVLAIGQLNSLIAVSTITSAIANVNSSTANLNITTLSISTLSTNSMNTLVGSNNILSVSSNIIAGIATITIDNGSLDLTQFITPITSEDIIGSLESLSIGILAIGTLSALTASSSIISALTSINSNSAIINVTNLDIDLTEFVTPITVQDIIDNIENITVTNLAAQAANFNLDIKTITSLAVSTTKLTLSFTEFSASIDKATFHVANAEGLGQEVPVTPTDNTNIITMLNDLVPEMEYSRQLEVTFPSAFDEDGLATVQKLFDLTDEELSAISVPIAVEESEKSQAIRKEFVAYPDDVRKKLIPLPKVTKEAMDKSSKFVSNHIGVVGNLKSKWEGVLAALRAYIKLSGSVGGGGGSGGSIQDGHKPPSLDIGMDYVPYDNFNANLHEGEMVLTKEEATNYRKGGDSTVITNNYITITGVDTIDNLLEEFDRRNIVLEGYSRYEQ